MRDIAQVNHLIQTTLDEFGQIDILVYATGTNIPDRSLEVLTHETVGNDDRHKSNRRIQLHKSGFARHAKTAIGPHYLSLFRMRTIARCIWRILSGIQARHVGTGARDIQRRTGKRHSHHSNLPRVVRHPHRLAAPHPHATRSHGQSIKARRRSRCMSVCGDHARASANTRTHSFTCGIIIFI